MAKSHPFLSIHSHGLIRVGARTPVATVGDPMANAEAAIALARDGHKVHADLLVFPELNISSYAIDDLHLQDALQAATQEALGAVVAASAKLRPVLLVGAALPRNGRLYNCAVAIARGRVLGVVPKTFLPNYREYYEKRWFARGAGVTGLEIEVAGQTAPFGTDLVFAASDLDDFVFHAEICEDFWTPTPPSTQGALAGALICCNLSASNIVVGKARERAMLCASQSARALCAYVFSATGPGESSTDLAWDGQGTIHELGELLAESARFGREPEILLADVDAGRLRQERMRNGSFNDAAVHAGHPETRFRRVAFEHKPDFRDVGLLRDIRRFPFVPNTPEKLDAECYEAYNIQVEALRDRFLGFSMPGFATGDTSRGNAWKLMRALGIDGDEIDIRPAAKQMLADMGHPYGRGEPVYDVTFENVQAGLRTDYLFRLANQRGGLVVGTGDLSELAMGWCAYGVGDQMSHYAVNAGEPRTLIQYLIRWCIRTAQYDGETDAVLEAILATEISPELVPAGADGAMQRTEARIGPYALNDFFLHYVVRHGMAPSKIAFLALHAWGDVEAGRWPRDLPAAARQAYDLATIKEWLEKFLFRFFTTSQFKRSAIPNGPKVSAGGALSPRGDWRAPSDGTAAAWLAELARNVP